MAARIRSLSRCFLYKHIYQVNGNSHAIFPLAGKLHACGGVAWLSSVIRNIGELYDLISQIVLCYSQQLLICSFEKYAFLLYAL